MPQALKSPSDELQQIYARGIGDYQDALDRLIRSVARDDPAQIRNAERALGDIIRLSQAQADAIGRRRMWLEFDVAASREGISTRDIERDIFEDRLTFAGERTPTPLVPQVPFAESINDLMSREPRVLDSLKTDGFDSASDWVSEIYSTEHGFSVARTTSPNVTDRVQKFLVKAQQEGIGRDEAVRQITKEGALDNWSKAYSDNVYRTNMNTSYSAGRFQQASKPSFQSFMPAFEFFAINDADVRRGRTEDNGENHLVLHRVIASTSSVFWRTFSPPLGYQCRCSIILVNKFELQRKGIDPDNIPDPRGFSPSIVHANFRNKISHDVYFGKV